MESGFCSAWQVGPVSLEHVLDSRWKGLFLEMEGFSDSPLERDELRDFEVRPTSLCGSAPLGIWHRAPPSCPPRGLDTMREHWVPLSGRCFAVTPAALIPTGSHQEKS